MYTTTNNNNCILLFNKSSLQNSLCCSRYKWLPIPKGLKEDIEEKPAPPPGEDTMLGWNYCAPMWISHLIDGASSSILPQVPKHMQSQNSHQLNCHRFPFLSTHTHTPLPSVEPQLSLCSPGKQKQTLHHASWSRTLNGPGIPSHPALIWRGQRKKEVMEWLFFPPLKGALACIIWGGGSSHWVDPHGNPSQQG